MLSQEINSFAIPSGASAIFEDASYFEHSCSPNCFGVFNKRGAIIIRAVKPIAKGQPATISYMATTRFTPERRRILEKSKFFNCTCDRCADPTEFGTMFSAVKCTNRECDGYMLPRTFLVKGNEPIPDFICNKCRAKLPSKDVDKMIDVIGAKYSKVGMDLKRLEAFIKEQEKIFHPNHSCILCAQIHYVMAFTTTNSLQNAKMPELVENVERCKNLLYVIETLFPNEFQQRAMLHFRIYLTMHPIHIMMERQKVPKPELLQYVRECKFKLLEVLGMVRLLPLEDKLLERCLVDIQHFEKVEKRLK